MITLTDYDGFSASYNDANFITVTPYTQNGVAGSKIEYITNTYTIEVAYVTSTPSTISGSSIYVQPLTIVLDNGQTEVFYLNPLFYKSYTAVGSNTQLIYEYDQAPQPQSYITSTSTSTINAQIAAVMGGGGSGWSLTGNAGTNPATNFLGTTDAQDLVIKTDSIERIRVLATGNVGIGVTPTGYGFEVAKSFYLHNDDISGSASIYSSTGSSLAIDVTVSGQFSSSVNFGNGGTSLNWSNLLLSFSHNVFLLDSGIVLSINSDDTKSLHLTDAGSVGIGTASPTEKLDVAGTAKANTLTLTTVPAYDDDAAAGAGGLLTGQLYQTTGSGAAPLNVAGILMIKQ